MIDLYDLKGEFTFSHGCRVGKVSEEAIDNYIQYLDKKYSRRRNRHKNPSKYKRRKYDRTVRTKKKEHGNLR